MNATTTPADIFRPDPSLGGEGGTACRDGRGNPAPGPTTAEGKAIAARNATTHGLFARDVVLPALGEDPAAFDVQQLVWKQARSFSPNADFDDACLDNTRPVPANNKNCQNEPPAQTQNCQNEPPAPTSSAAVDHASPTPFPPGEGWPRNEAGVGLPSKNCQNEPSRETPTPPAKLSLADINTPEGYLAYRKREQEMYCRRHPEAPPGIDWDDPDVRQGYGAS